MFTVKAYSNFSIDLYEAEKVQVSPANLNFDKKAQEIVLSNEGSAKQILYVTSVDVPADSVIGQTYHAAWIENSAGATTHRVRPLE